MGLILAVTQALGDLQIAIVEFIYFWIIICTFVLIFLPKLQVLYVGQETGANTSTSLSFSMESKAFSFVQLAGLDRVTLTKYIAVLSQHLLKARQRLAGMTANGGNANNPTNTNVSGMQSLPGNVNPMKSQAGYMKMSNESSNKQNIDNNSQMGTNDTDIGDINGMYPSKPGTHGSTPSYGNGSQLNNYGNGNGNGNVRALKANPTSSAMDKTSQHLSKLSTHVSGSVQGPRMSPSSSGANDENLPLTAAAGAGGGGAGGNGGGPTSSQTKSYSNDVSMVSANDPITPFSS
jgi:hypothetical protein